MASSISWNNPTMVPWVLGSGVHMDTGSTAAEDVGPMPTEQTCLPLNKARTWFLVGLPTIGSTTRSPSAYMPLHIFVPSSGATT